MEKYTETAKMSKDVEGGPSYSKTSEKESMKSATLQNHTQNYQVTNSLLPCPECPFSTLSASTLIQHKYKHSLGKPYLCPYCHARQPTEELHTAHQKRNHPTKNVVINKRINTRLGQSTGSMNSSLMTSKCVSPSSPSALRQTCKTDQVASSEPPSTSAYSDVFYSFIAVVPESKKSKVKTEISPPILGQSKSKRSTLSSPDCHTQKAMLQTKTQKTGKRQRVSILHGRENSKCPSLEHMPTPPSVNTPVTQQKSSRKNNITGSRRSLRSRKRMS